jgi:hypothetical protein
MHHRDLMAWIHTYQEPYFVAYIFIVLAWVSKIRTSLRKRVQLKTLTQRQKLPLSLTQGDDLQKFLPLAPEDAKWSHLHSCFICPSTHARCRVGWAESCFGHGDTKKIVCPLCILKLSHTAHNSLYWPSYHAHKYTFTLFTHIKHYNKFHLLFLLVVPWQGTEHCLIQGNLQMVATQLQIALLQMNNLLSCHYTVATNGVHNLRSAWWFTDLQSH